MSMSTETHEAHNHPTETCPAYLCPGAVLMVTAKDVTDEVIEYVVDLVDSDYGDSPIDWQSVFDDRLEGMTMADGRTLSLGEEYDTPAQRKVQRAVRKIRSAG